VVAPLCREHWNAVAALADRYVLDNQDEIGACSASTTRAVRMDRRSALPNS
jgi:hypothetical protein